MPPTTRDWPVLRQLLKALGICLVAAYGSASWAQSPPDPSLLARLQPPLVAAHRGGEFGLPNTLVQFATALESRDADILEMDLRLTADNRVVIYHDETLDKRTNCHGQVESMTYAELIQCRRSNGERIPLFSDVLVLVRGQRLVSAELKSHDMVEPVINAIMDANASKWVYLQIQNDRHRYDAVRAVAPSVVMMFKAKTTDDVAWIIAQRDPALKIIELDRDLVTVPLVRMLHNAGKLVSVDTWRYQFSEERFAASCDRAFAAGADIAVTNNPASCNLQRKAWGDERIDAGVFYDRQHVRGWARAHPHLLRAGLYAGAGCLLFGLALGWRRGWRSWRVGNGAPPNLLPNTRL